MSAIRKIGDTWFSQPGKKTSRTICIVVLLVAIAFLIFAFSYPEMSLPWSNTIIYLLYGSCCFVVVTMFVAPFKRKKT